VTVVATCVAIRALHRELRTPSGATRAPVVSTPGGRPESLPPTLSVPEDLPVAPGVPHVLHGDAQRSHRAHGHLPARAEVAWTFKADGAIEGQVVASPDEATLYVATLGGTLWALDRVGHPRFHVPLGGRAYATPAVGPDGTVFVGSDGGAFFAVSPAGSVAWRLETHGGDADTSALLLDDGLVVFAAGSRVYGVRPGGVVAFRFQAKGKVFTAPALTRGGGGREPRIIVGSQDDHVYALTTAGALAWATDLGSDVDGAPAVGDDGGIYVGTDRGEVVRLEDDGRVAWRARVDGFVRGTLSVTRGGDVLAGVFGPSPRLARLSPGGELLGAYPIRGNGTGETGVLGGALEDDDGALAFGGDDGAVHVVGRDGQLRWEYDAGADVDAPVTLLGDGSLVAATYDGEVIALRSP